MRGGRVALLAVSAPPKDARITALANRGVLCCLAFCAVGLELPLNSGERWREASALSMTRACSCRANAGQVSMFVSANVEKAGIRNLCRNEFRSAARQRHSSR
jgi:hypothetical protein